MASNTFLELVHFERISNVHGYDSRVISVVQYGKVISLKEHVAGRSGREASGLGTDGRGISKRPF